MHSRLVVVRFLLEKWESAFKGGLGAKEENNEGPTENETPHEGNEEHDLYHPPPDVPDVPLFEKENTLGEETAEPKWRRMLCSNVDSPSEGNYRERIVDHAMPNIR